LHGVSFFVEKLGDERAAEAVALVFVTVDLDAVLEGGFGSFEGADGRGDFGSSGGENLDEIDGAGADGIDAIKDKAAGGGVDEVDDVVQLAGELVDIFAVKRRNEGLIELGEDIVGDLVAGVLDGLDDLHLFGHAGVMREQVKKSRGAALDVYGLLDEQGVETLFARHKPLQKSWHVERLPPQESWAKAV